MKKIIVWDQKLVFVCFGYLFFWMKKEKKKDWCPKAFPAWSRGNEGLPWYPGIHKLCELSYLAKTTAKLYLRTSSKSTIKSGVVKKEGFIWYGSKM